MADTWDIPTNLFGRVLDLGVESAVEVMLPSPSQKTAGGSSYSPSSVTAPADSFVKSAMKIDKIDPAVPASSPLFAKNLQKRLFEFAGIKDKRELERIYAYIQREQEEAMNPRGLV